MEAVNEVCAVVDADRVFSAKRAPLMAAGLGPTYDAVRAKLLRERVKGKGESDRRGAYLRVRRALQERRYGAVPKTERTKTVDKSRMAEMEMEREKVAEELAKKETKKEKREYAEIPDEELFAFAGMHHIFGEQRQRVPTVKFGNLSKDLLAFACDDSALRVCSIVSEPGIKFTLSGHNAPVTDFCWSMDNSVIVSLSEDKTVRVWDAVEGKCNRVVKVKGEPLCCAFFPLNYNFCVIGGRHDSSPKRGVIRTLNLSTGRFVSSFNVAAPVRDIVFNDSDTTFFAATLDGKIFVMQMDLMCNPTIRSEYNVGCVPWSLDLKTWFYGGERKTYVLASCSDGSIKFFCLDDFILYNIHSFAIKNTKERIRARFCPLTATRESVCFVSGSEDSAIYIYNSTNKQLKKPINVLQGHLGPVCDVSWSFDETMLASCDSCGLVYVWKRVLNVNT